MASFPPPLQPLSSRLASTSTVEEPPQQNEAVIERKEETQSLQPQSLPAFERFRLLQEEGERFLQEFVERGQLEVSEQAKAKLEEALNLLSNPSDEILSPSLKMAGILKSLALLYLERKEYEEALVHFQKGWALCKPGQERVSDREILRCHKGLALEYFKFLQKCRYDVDRYEGKWEGCPFSKEYVGFLQNHQDNFPDPESICVQALQDHESNSLDLRATIASTYYATGQYHRAEKASLAYLKAGSELKYKLEMKELLAEIQMNINKYGEARIHLEEACWMDPSPERIARRSKKILDARFGEELCRDDKIRRAARGLIVQKPRAAKALFEEDMQLESSFVAGVHIETLEGVARACLHLNPPDLKTARSNLIEALKIVEGDRSSPSKKKKLSAENQARVYHCLADLALLEKNSEEAKRHFKEGISVCPALVPLVSDCISFLAERKEFGEALRICEEGFNEGSLGEGVVCWLRAKIYSAEADSALEEGDKRKAIAKWIQVKENCDKALPYFSRIIEKQLEILDLAAGASLQLDEKVAAYNYMLQAYRNDESIHFIERYEKLKELHSQIEWEHDKDRKVPRKSLKDMLAVVNQLLPHHCEEALRILEHIARNFLKRLTSLERFQLFLEVAKLFLVPSLPPSLLEASFLRLKVRPEDFPEAIRGQIDQAISQLPEGFELSPEHQAEVYYYRGSAYLLESEILHQLGKNHLLNAKKMEVKEAKEEEEKAEEKFREAKGKEERAEEEFKRGWEICRVSENLLSTYAKFLIRRELCRTENQPEFFDQGNKILQFLLQAEVAFSKKYRVGTPFVPLRLQIEYHSARNAWLNVRKICDRLMPFLMRRKEITEIHAIAAEACLKMERYDEALRCALRARDEADPLSFIDRAEEYKKILRAHVFNSHFTDLADKKPFLKQKAVLADKVDYFYALQSAYETQLTTTHIGWRIDLLLRTSYFQAQQGKFVDAVGDCQKVFEILEANKSRIAEKGYEEVISKVTKQSDSFMDRKLPKKLYQLPPDRILFSR